MDAHKMSLVDFTKHISSKVGMVKNKEDKQHNEMTKIALLIPSFILGIIMNNVGYLNLNLGLEFKPMGMKKNVMGNFVLTNIGTLGMQ